MMSSRSPKRMTEVEDMALVLKNLVCLGMGGHYIGAYGVVRPDIGRRSGHKIRLSHDMPEFNQ